MVLPVVVYNLYAQLSYTTAATLVLLVVLLGNIALLSSGRDAAVSLPVLLLLSIGVVLLSFYRGQDFALFLLYPLLVALPVLLRMNWALGLALISAVTIAPLILFCIRRFVQVLSSATLTGNRTNRQDIAQLRDDVVDCLVSRHIELLGVTRAAPDGVLHNYMKRLVDEDTRDFTR